MPNGNNLAPHFPYKVKNFCASLEVCTVQLAPTVYLNQCLGHKVWQLGTCGQIVQYIVPCAKHSWYWLVLSIKTSGAKVQEMWALSVKSTALWNDSYSCLCAVVVVRWHLALTPIWSKWLPQEAVHRATGRKRWHYDRIIGNRRFWCWGINAFRAQVGCCSKQWLGRQK